MSDGKNIDAIEERLHDHERELYRTLESIREKLTSRELVGELYERARASGYAQALGRAVRDNPIPTVLAGICGAWLAKSMRDAVVSERERKKVGTTREIGTTPELSQVALADTAAGGRPGEQRPAEATGEEREEPEGGRVVLPPSSRPQA